MRIRYLYRPDHPRANERGFVSADEIGYEDPTKALDAPVMVGRFYENQKALDGTDIGSRAKHREYMRRNNLTTVDDYKQTWEKKAQERADYFTTGGDHKARREAVERALHKLTK